MNKIQKRFESKFVPVTESGCWLWMGATVHKGYGDFFFSSDLGKRKNMTAHRASWVIYKGEIPKGAWVLHKCDVPCCVNPNHLFLGDCSTNNLDMKQKGRAVEPPKAKQNRDKTHCKNGHEFSKENTYIFPDGSRRCRICFRTWERNRYARFANRF